MLAQSSAARKERLAALRRHKEAGETMRKFRNYDPETRDVRMSRGGAGANGDGDEGKEQQDTVERDVADIAAKVLAEDALRRDVELDLTSIQPRRPNWDLKRDLEKRMTVLERRTEAGIRALIRQRLRDEGSTAKQQHLAAMLSSTET